MNKTNEIMEKIIEVVDNFNDYSKSDLEIFRSFMWETYRNVDSELKRRETEKIFSGIINKYIKYYHGKNRYSIMYVRYADLSQHEEIGETQKYIRLTGVGFKCHVNSPYWDDNYTEFATDFEIKVPASVYYEANKYRIEHPNLDEDDFSYWNDRIDEITEEEFINEYKQLTDNSYKTFIKFCEKIKEELNSDE